MVPSALLKLLFVVSSGLNLYFHVPWNITDFRTVNLSKVKLPFPNYNLCDIKFKSQTQNQPLFAKGWFSQTAIEI